MSDQVAFQGTPTLAFIAGNGQTLGQEFGAEAQGVLAPGTEVGSFIVPGGTIGPRGLITMSGICRVVNGPTVGRIWALRGDVNGAECWNYVTAALGNGGGVSWAFRFTWKIHAPNSAAQIISSIDLDDTSNIAGDLDTQPFAMLTTNRRAFGAFRRAVDLTSNMTIALRASSSAADAAMRFQIHSMLVDYHGVLVAAL